jgi:hypothetical protein
MTFTFQGRSSVSWKWRTFRANKHQQKNRKSWTNSRLLIVNLFLLTLRSTLTFTRTVTFWGAWQKMCDEKDRNFGATTSGSFIMTTRPPTCPWKPQNLWLTTWLSFPSSLLAGLSPLWFRFVSQIENETEGTTFWNSVWHPKGIASGTRQH